MATTKKVPGKDGNVYVPYEARTGEEAVVYFTRDLSPTGLVRLYDRIKEVLTGKIAIKLHTGEPHGPNIIPRPWVKELIAKRLQGQSIVETNTYYEGERYTTEQHRNTLKVNGWDFAPVDIMDEEGTTKLPVPKGKWFDAMSVGTHLLTYDSLLALTHFKGHVQGGFGGSNKNIGIGCADGRIGKKMIHTTPNQPDMWDIAKEELMERITESTLATITHFGHHVAYLNVLRNMSVSCDCEGTAAEPVVTPDIGMVASVDLLAVDQASVDLVYALPEESKHALVERMESRHGLRQLSYMKEMNMGHDRYRLIDIDHDDAVITAQEAVAGIKGTWVLDAFQV
ncbi:DUF362 domain-containing protein [Veillonella magna]|uniref:DUF362 domain-containing protein n=1 Tax=Veillonella magna TaxID=464322 RepID=A0ABS2GD23_9FIRM|nr:DUF362 domain-containing protein [Veillonella magna]MBM6823916.1 DUF362 domain-containing protein [Veillonella magna]MBM6912056.1 DUF362 domain-containing protein [Veillonella magna]